MSILLWIYRLSLVSESLPAQIIAHFKAAIFNKLQKFSARSTGTAKKLIFSCSLDFCKTIQRAELNRKKKYAYIFMQIWAANLKIFAFSAKTPTKQKKRAGLNIQRVFLLKKSRTAYAPATSAIAAKTSTATTALRLKCG